MKTFIQSCYGETIIVVQEYKIMMIIGEMLYYMMLPSFYYVINEFLNNKYIFILDKNFL